MRQKAHAARMDRSAMRTNMWLENRRETDHSENRGVSVKVQAGQGVMAAPVNTVKELRVPYKTN